MKEVPGSRKAAEIFAGRSLSTKIAVLFGLIILIGCLLLFLVSVNYSGSILEAGAKETMLKVAKNAAEIQESRNQALIYIVEGIAFRNVIRGIQGNRDSTFEEKLKALSDESKRAANMGFKNFAIADKEGNAFVSDGTKVNVADRGYFKEALQGKTVFSSSLVSRHDSSVVFVVATPVRHYSSNEISGVLIGIVDAARMSNLVGGIAYEKTGYAFAVDGAGKTIAHKDIERVLKEENIIELAKSNEKLSSLADVISKMANGEEGVTTYNFQGVNKIVAYAPVKSANWSIAITAPQTEVLERTHGIKVSMFLASVLIILSALIIAFIAAKTITIPLVNLTMIVRRLAEYDFKFNEGDKKAIKYLRRKDEIGQIANALAGMKTNISSIIKNLKNDSKTLAENSESLGAMSEEIASSSSETAKAIQEVATGNVTQTEDVQHILELTQQIALNLGKVNTELGRVKNNSDITTKQAYKGKQELNKLINSINSVHDDFKTVAERLGMLKDSVNQVAEILEAINNIADRTNLLALNAAIEAARAGEAGRGFAVVSDEVRKLAEQSRVSSGKIAKLLNNITSETNEVFATSEKVNIQINGQFENIGQTIKAFDDILDSVVAIGPMIEATYKEMDSTVKSKDEVLDKVQNVSSVAEEISASAEEIAASAEELSASTQEIAANAQQVMDIAKRLDEQAGRFSI